jgi:hypothetical protein
MEVPRNARQAAVLRGSPVIGLAVLAEPERGVLRAVEWWPIQLMSSVESFVLDSR